MKLTFVALTLSNGTSVYINADKIEAIFKGKENTHILIPAHNNGGFCVKETPEQIFELINNS